MDKRLLADGHVITRAKPSAANHNIYYVDAGPEGKVVALDLNVIPMSVILACIAWEHDITNHDKHPAIEFTKTGFRY